MDAERRLRRSDRPTVFTAAHVLGDRSASTVGAEHRILGNVLAAVGARHQPPQIPQLPFQLLQLLQVVRDLPHKRLQLLSFLLPEGCIITLTQSLVTLAQFILYLCDTATHLCAFRHLPATLQRVLAGLVDRAGKPIKKCHGVFPPYHSSPLSSFCLQ